MKNLAKDVKRLILVDYQYSEAITRSMARLFSRFTHPAAIV
ncbi:hypothetical protein [Acinetobacter brisouii]|nr:hypothetical protein [Acinetobacter brisouii]